MSRATVPLAPLLLVLVCAGCASAPSVRGLPEAAPAGVPGFDLRIHPGHAAMAAWREHSPYRWVGYYLPAPCHTGRSWLGTRAALERQGWGLAVLFVGEQDWGASSAPPPEPGAPCVTANLTAERGRSDAATADSVAQAEGFPPGTVIFLDVEPVDTVSPALLAYARAWAEALAEAGRYRPGLYAHAANAETLHGAMRLAAAGSGGGDPPLWVVRPDPAFDLAAAPSGSGVSWADAWQGGLEVAETWGGVTLTVDRNVARAMVGWR